MKIAFSFLVLSTLVLITQQQRYVVPRMRNALPPSSLFHHEPSIQDIYDYLYARSAIQSMKMAGQTPDYASNAQVGSAPQWADAQSRSKNSGYDVETNLDDDSQGNARVFLNYVTTVGATSSYFNPLLKTVYYISITTATTTLVNTCVPAASFDATSYTVVCRKRRDVLEMLLDGEDSQDIISELKNDPAMSPTKVTSVETTATAALPRDLGDDAILVPVELASSMTEDYLIEKGYLSEADKTREKRFLIASTTITSFTFVTTTSVKTLSNILGTLSCLPSQFSLC